MGIAAAVEASGLVAAVVVALGVEASTVVAVESWVSPRVAGVAHWVVVATAWVVGALVEVA